LKILRAKKLQIQQKVSETKNIKMYFKYKIQQISVFARALGRGQINLWKMCYLALLKCIRFISSYHQLQIAPERCRQGVWPFAKERYGEVKVFFQFSNLRDVDANEFPNLMASFLSKGTSLVIKIPLAVFYIHFISPNW